MDPVTLNLIVSLVENLIAQEPAIAADIQNIFSGGTPTAAQWQQLRADIAAGKYATE